MKNHFKTGERVEVTIESVAFGGSGVARVRQMVVFVPFTVDQDRVLVRITEVKKTYLRGKVEKILAPSPRRVDPPCPYFLRCGGCQVQHVAYPHQLEMKKSQVIEAFRRIGKFDSPPVQDVRPSPKTFSYRGKAEFHWAGRRGNTPQIGFMDVGGSRVVDVERCGIVDESINEALGNFRKDLLSGRLALESRGESTGTRVIWSENGNSASWQENAADKGSQEIIRIVKGRPMRVPAAGFFQANASLVDQLVDEVLDLSALTGKENVLDCYCGAGLFSLFLAGHARKVFAVEIDGEAVEAARKNFADFGHPEAAVFAGAVEEVLKGPLSGMKGDVDVVVLDPPRTGCEREVLAILAAWKPKRLVYVSCDPATQARDIRCLVDQGFSLRVLQPFDMFPQTKHVEVVALLES